MRKKILTILGITFLIPILIGNLEISASEENSFYNKNDVLIYESDYEIFNALGYEEQDIDYLTQDQVDELRTINVGYSFSDEKYVKTEYVYYENDLIEIRELNLTKEEFELEKLDSSNTIIDNDLNINPYSLYNYNRESYSENFDLKTIRLNGVFDTNYCHCNSCDKPSGCSCSGCSGSCSNCTCSSGAHGRFIISLTVNWVGLPAEKYVDLVGISTPYSVNKKNRYINGIEYPLFTFTTWYNAKLYDEEFNLFDEPEIVRGYNATNIEYNYGIGEGLYVVLPLGEFLNDALYNGITQEYHVAVLHQMRVRLEAHFIRNNTNIIAYEFAGWYSHETLGLTSFFDELVVDINTDPPFIHFSTSMSVDFYYVTEGLTISFEYISDEEDDNVGTC